MNIKWDEHTNKLSNFIKTKSRPHIFYLPKKHNNTTQHLLDSTKLQLTAQIQSRRKKFDEIIDTKYRIKPRKEFHKYARYES
ncbi:Pinin [Oopsacas minuta]|uniref:Pinin n=1 Tax=Oopsacas minuta TaxID=111878 RepID=A0AAV7KJL0_9METZ|nr:Pinin [Oopsacas minuta]